jgi:imidazole glycerol-phosphate synthase subunit HisF
MVFTNNGRQPTGFQAKDWILNAVERGAGEIVLTSVDREGTKRGVDLTLIHEIISEVEVPVVVHGGVGTPAHILEAAQLGVSGIAIASALHYNLFTVRQVKQYLGAAGLETRE